MANPSHVTEVEGQDDGDGSTLKVVLLGSEWNSLAGGISTLNRELAIHLAEDPKLKVTVLVPEKSCKDEEKREARRYGVTIVDAEELPGYHPLDWLSFPPKDLGIDIVIGHGAKLGRQGQVIRNAPQRNNCKWVQLVHTASEDLGKFKNYNNPISQGERKHQIEVDLCKRADLVVPIGPRLEEFYSSYLRRYKKDIFTLTPGLFAREFGDLEQASGDNAVFRVLIFGRGDLEDFELKGYNIAAEAFTDQRLKKKPNYQLIFVGAPDGKQDEVAEKLVHCGIAKEQLDVRGFVRSREKMKDILCEVDLAVMPSKSEGFGLVALEALSAGLPILVGSRSGIAKALENVPNGDKCIVNSDDPAKWAEAIEAVHVKHRMRLKEIKVLQDSYSKMYSWKEQCRALVERMRKMVHVRSVNYYYDNTFGRLNSILHRQVEITPNFQKMQRELQELKEEVSKKDDEKIKREKEIKENEELHEEKIFKLTHELENTRKEMEDYKTRIAFLGDKRVKQDQSQCEDTLSKNKQSKLEEEFSSFVDGTRVDACDRFRELYKPKDQVTEVHCQRLACLIFEASYERMNGAKEALVEFFKEVSKCMIESAPEMSFDFTRNEYWVKGKGASWYSKGNFYKVQFPVSLMRQNSNYPKDVVDALMLAVKETAYDCKLDCFVKDVKAIIRQKWESWRSNDRWLKIVYDYRVLEDAKVVCYIKECIKIVWCMITQVPAMKIEYQSTQLRSFHTQKGCYRGMPSTGRDPKEEIAYYLWPALFDGGDRLVRKAEVLCKTS